MTTFTDLSDERPRPGKSDTGKEEQGAPKPEPTPPEPPQEVPKPDKNDQPGRPSPDHDTEREEGNDPRRTRMSDQP